MIWKRAELLRPALDALLAATDAPERVRGDPVELPHRYSDPQDVEVAALLSAALAYGRVDLFKPRLEKLLARLGPSPASTARDSTPRQLLRRAQGFAYRMTDARDVACLLYGAGRFALDFLRSTDRSDSDPRLIDAIARSRFSRSTGTKPPASNAVPMIGNL